MYIETSILVVDTENAAEGKVATILVLSPSKANLCASEAANSQSKRISRHIRKSFLPLQNRLTGNERSSLRERFQPERLDTVAKARVGEQTSLMSEETARVGEETILCLEKVPEIAWGGNYVSKIGKMETTAIAETWIFSWFADSAGDTREGDQDGDTMSTTTSSWCSHNGLAFSMQLWMKTVENNENMRRQEHKFWKASNTQPLRPTRPAQRREKRKRSTKNRSWKQSILCPKPPNRLDTNGSISSTVQSRRNEKCYW